MPPIVRQEVASAHPRPATLRLSDNRAIRRFAMNVEVCDGRDAAVGSRYLMVEPEHFRVDYAINPFMHLDDQPDPVARPGAVAGDRGRGRGGRRQRRVARAARRRPGHGLRDEPRPPGRGGAGDRVVLSHMRYPERRMETATAEAWFADARLRADRRRPRRRRRAPRGRRRVRLARRPGRRLRPAHRGARAQAPRDRARTCGCRACGSRTPACTTSTSASARSTPRTRWSARPRSTTPPPAPCWPWCRSRWCCPRRRR